MKRYSRKHVIVVYIIALIVGFIIGYMVGTYSTLLFGMKIAEHFLHIQFSPEAMSRLIAMYPQLNSIIIS